MKSIFTKSLIVSLSVMGGVIFSSVALAAPTAKAKPGKAVEEKASNAKVPLSTYLKKDKPVMGEVGAVVPPQEINKYIAKVQAAAKEDPAWHQEYAKNSKPGLPLPWHEKLGLTKDEYDEYIKLWDQRKFKMLQKVVIRLEEPKPGELMIRVSGVGMPISLLRYYPKTDIFKSTNGEMKRIEDINADKRSILGAWKGQEWRYEKKTEFEWTKENFAIGKETNGKHCLMIYRIQESMTGYDKSLVIRFMAPSSKK